MEAKAKASEPISIVDLASAINAEQKGGKGKPKEKNNPPAHSSKRTQAKKKPPPKKRRPKRK